MDSSDALWILFFVSTYGCGCKILALLDEIGERPRYRTAFVAILYRNTDVTGAILRTLALYGLVLAIVGIVNSATTFVMLGILITVLCAPRECYRAIHHWRTIKDIQSNDELEAPENC